MAPNAMKLVTLFLCVVFAVADPAIPQKGGRPSSTFQATLQTVQSGLGALSANITKSSPAGAPAVAAAASTCKFALVNRCRSRSNVLFSVGGIVSSAVASTGWFNIPYGQSSGTLSWGSPTYILAASTRNVIAVPGATGVTSFCANTRQQSFTYMYVPSARVWAALGANGKIIYQGKSCASIGGTSVNGFYKLGRCGVTITFTNC